MISKLLRRLVCGIYFIYVQYINNSNTLNPFTTSNAQCTPSVVSYQPTHLFTSFKRSFNCFQNVKNHIIVWHVRNMYSLVLFKVPFHGKYNLWAGRYFTPSLLFPLWRHYIDEISVPAPLFIINMFWFRNLFICYDIQRRTKLLLPNWIQ